MSKTQWYIDGQFVPSGKFLGNSQRPIARIITEVSKSSGVSVSEILGRRRTADVIRARFAAMAICRDYLALSYPAIGRAFNRDHTCVINAMRRIDVLVDDTDLDDFEEIARRAGLVEGE